mmetsp:Transcript_99763/g.242588  ORF Transcript_99763/g.242588 Transcript_99763/m.242588 type:complete len:203 (+) Transcript_99763:163-771(+)
MSSKPRSCCLASTSLTRWLLCMTTCSLSSASGVGKRAVLPAAAVLLEAEVELACGCEPSPPLEAFDSATRSWNTAATAGSFAANSAAVAFVLGSLSSSCAPAWRRASHICASPSSAASMSAVRPSAPGRSGSARAASRAPRSSTRPSPPPEASRATSHNGVSQKWLCSSTLIFKDRRNCTTSPTPFQHKLVTGARTETWSQP